MLNKSMKILLIGCGNFGKHYLRILKESGHLYGVVVKSDKSALRISKEHDVKVFTQISLDILQEIDGVMVVTPSNTHKELIEEVLPYVPVFCEKPLALNSKDINDIIRLETDTGNKLMVGHIYRFNNVVKEIKKIISNDKPKEIVIRFLGGSKNNCGVMHEFMHGFDIMLNLFDKYELIDRALKLDNGGDAEYVKLKFNCNGIICVIELGWESESKVRDLSLIYEDKKIKCDLVKQTINGDNYFVEPLKLEIRRFIDILKGEDLYYPDTTLTNDIQKIIDDIGKYT